MTPRPDDVPAELVEELEGFGGVVLDMDEMMRRFRGAIAHPAFAPWFLRLLAQREPDAIEAVARGLYDEFYVSAAEGFTPVWAIETTGFREVWMARARRLLNALAAPTPPRAEEGR